ncbi:MAG TPA: DinB family protein [Candidatus Limnocylindrales bacterium]|nr:DinB family protein [Candidatus Limnocylindrales bacterium]
MEPAEIRYLFAYDRWATQKVLDQLDGVEADLWGAAGVVGDRGLGSILVHMLGAHQRWRLAFEGSEDSPSPEDEPLPTAPKLVARWVAELDATDRFLDEVTPGFLAVVREGVKVSVMLQHLANHGTQHRSEAALLLTQAGRSPGELDLIFFAEDVVAGRLPDPSAEGAA